MMLTQHFALEELDCSCGCPLPRPVLQRLQRLAQALEVLRAELGQPVQVISGYRCPGRNRAVKGARSSRHIEGDAVDIQVAGMTGGALRDILERLIAERRIPDGGLGTYADRPRTCHYDQRTLRARWHHG